ncbi:aryl hydrocarbon receptor-like isoform X3 [Alligator sinensis]|uniref:Aryl hydrocarbon receptor-like isoform X3 n=1 Tax=Alligator sinensis TaxID=38654 RepID=A0A3Q0G653_ALLSI|nr:aryl hydrocarbon receptor-like isoform X3 [Alligator sinensis]
MLPAGGGYAVKRRKKPVQKSPKLPPPEGVKSNPSKRHRDRLNQELNKLTSLLPFPEDVQARLDKLSILRLIVGYLKLKSYFVGPWTRPGKKEQTFLYLHFMNNYVNHSPDMRATAKNNGSSVTEQTGAPGGTGQTNLQINGEAFSEGDLLLQSDLIYQSVYELIHTDDRAMFRCQLHWALNPPASNEPDQSTDAMPLSQTSVNSDTATYDPQHLPPENSSFLERSFICRFRCLLDNSSGFLALNFQGRLKFLHGQQKRAADGSLMPPQLALFAIATPLQPLSILELRTKTFIFQTKHKLDFTPTACDSRGKVVLGYTETELCMRGSGYQFVHAADMMYCAENHVRMMKTGESGITVFRLLTKKAGWVWVQANARLVYKGGRPDCIIARQRALSNEEGEEHLRKRSLQLPFSFATGEAVLYENNLPGFLDSFQAKTGSKTKKDALMEQDSIDPNSLLGAMMKQDESVYVSHANNVPQLSLADILDVVEEPCQNERNEEDIKEENNPFLVIIETLFEKSNIDSNICQTLQNLDVDDLQLQHWEETLLTMDVDEPVAQDFPKHLGDEVASYVEEMLYKKDNGKNMDFPQCSATASSQAIIQQIPLQQIQQSSHLSTLQTPLRSNVKCSEQSTPPGYFQHCWGTEPSISISPVSQNPMQFLPQSTLGSDPQVPLVAATPKNLFSRPKKQAPFDQPDWLRGNISDPLGSVNQPTVGVNKINPVQVFQQKGTSSVPLKNLIPKNQMQLDSNLIGSNHAIPLKVNQQDRQQHDPLVSINSVIGFHQDNSPGSHPSDIWKSPVQNQLRINPVQMEPQAVLADGQQNVFGSRVTNPWMSSSQTTHYAGQGVQGFGVTQHNAISASLLQKSSPVESEQLCGSHSFPKQAASHKPHPIPNFYNKEKRQILQAEQLLTEQQQLLQAELHHQVHCRPAQMRDNGLPLISCLESKIQSHSQVEMQQMDSVLEASLKLSSNSTLPSSVVQSPWKYASSEPPFENDAEFAKAAHTTCLLQQPNTEPCHAGSNPEALCYYQRPTETVLGSLITSPLVVGLRANSYRREPNLPPMSITEGPLNGQQQLFTCNIQLKCHQNEENAPMEFTPAVAKDSMFFPKH